MTHRKCDPTDLTRSQRWLQGVATPPKQMQIISPLTLFNKLNFLTTMAGITGPETVLEILQIFTIIMHSLQIASLLKLLFHPVVWMQLPHPMSS